MSKDYMVMSTQETQEHINRICDKIAAGMSPENTLSDFVTELAIELGNECIGKDMMDKTVIDLENEEVKNELLMRLLSNKLGYRIFGEILKPEELI